MFRDLSPLAVEADFVDLFSGQIAALDLLEEILPLSVTEHLSNKNLDSDLSYFLSRPSTLENLCMFAWRNIGVVTRPHPIKVVKVEVESHPCKRNEFSAKLERVRVSYEGMHDVSRQSEPWISTKTDTTASTWSQAKG